MAYRYGKALASWKLAQKELLSVHNAKDIFLGRMNVHIKLHCIMPVKLSYSLSGNGKQWTNLALCGARKKVRVWQKDHKDLSFGEHD